MKTLEYDKGEIVKRIQNEKSLTNKCILCRAYLPPQSTVMETIIKNDLMISPPKNRHSGDGQKNGISYEIKYSGHAKKSKLNFVQLRPGHNIDFYIFVCYNMYRGVKGKAYILKIPSKKIGQLIVNYGSYAHGTIKRQGPITKNTLKGRGLEYALRCDPNAASTTKSGKLWKQLLQYKTSYHPDNF